MRLVPSHIFNLFHTVLFTLSLDGPQSSHSTVLEPKSKMATNTKLRLTLTRGLLILSFVNIATSQNNEPGAVPPDSDGAADEMKPEDLLAKVEEIDNLITESPSMNPDNDKESLESIVPPPIQEVGTILGGGASCTFCDTQDRFDPDLEFAGIPCDQWSFLSVFAPPGDECTLIRAAAVKFCGCPTQVEETCQLCPNGYEGYQEDQSILFVQDVICKDLVGFVAVDGETTCDFVDRFSYTCGCPDVIPSCSLCGQNSDGEHLQMTRPDEVLVEDENSPFAEDTTCADWDKILSIDSQSNPLTMVAQGRSAMTPCEQSLKISEERTGLQLDGLCGCPGVEPPNNCSPCGEGFELETGRDDCDRLTFVMPYVTNATRCAFLQERAIVVGCCVLSELDFETFQPTQPPNDELPSNNDIPPNNNLPPPDSEQAATSSAPTLALFLETVAVSLVVLLLVL